MASSPSDNFAKMFLPDHPHRRLHILLSVLAFVIVVGSITLYQMHKADRPKQLTVPSMDDPDELTEAKRKKLAEVSQSLTVQPQTTQFEVMLEKVSKSLNQK